MKHTFRASIFGSNDTSFSNHSQLKEELFQRHAALLRVYGFQRWNYLHVNKVTYIVALYEVPSSVVTLLGTSTWTISRPFSHSELMLSDSKLIIFYHCICIICIVSMENRVHYHLPTIPDVCIYALLACFQCVALSSALSLRDKDTILGVRVCGRHFGLQPGLDIFLCLLCGKRWPLTIHPLPFGSVSLWKLNWKAVIISELASWDTVSLTAPYISAACFFSLEVVCIAQKRERIINHSLKAFIAHTGFLYEVTFLYVLSWKYLCSGLWK